MSDYTQHPDYQAQLAGIIAQPDDDVRRLVLADWIQEHGDSDRADFIRTQIELAKVPVKERRDFDGPAQVEVRRRLGRLRSQDKDRVMNGAITVGRKMFEDYTAKRDKLVDRTMRLLWACENEERPYNWQRWCWAAGRDEDWMPIRGDGRGGMVVMPCATPKLDAEPYRCTVPTPRGQLEQVWWRGFVDEIRCKVELWTAGWCEGCEGVGDDGGRFEQYTVCPTCHGSGEGANLGSLIVAAHPVTKLKLTDSDYDLVHPLLDEGFDEMGRPIELEHWFVLSDYWHLGEGLDGEFEAKELAIEAIEDRALRWARTKALLKTVN